MVKKMTEYKLSQRLQKVASFIPKGASIADIGSDHAYLPVYLCKKNIANYVVAGEVNEGPYLSAQKQVRMNLLEDKINVKLGDGLSVLQDEVVNTIVIAGMGGPLISTILDDGIEFLTNVKRLILQPNIAADHIRQWLLQHDWSLIDEALLEEVGHIYEILVAERGNPKAAYSTEIEKEVWLGPFLLRNKSNIFEQKWLRELEQLETINRQLQSATNETAKTRKKKEEIVKKIEWLKEELR